eukprot:793046-Pyramimonas_sp.AAC.1
MADVAALPQFVEGLGLCILPYWWCCAVEMDARAHPGTHGLRTLGVPTPAYLFEAQTSSLRQLARLNIFHD